MFSQEVLTQFIMNYGYWALLIGVTIEGPIVTVLAGFLTSLGFFNIYYVYLITVFADMIGDWGSYAIGYFGRNRVLLKFLSWFQIKEEKLLEVDKFFKKHGGKSVFISKFVAGAGSWTLISAGIGRMDLKKFFKYSLIGSLIKSIVYLSVGFFFGTMYQTINKWMNKTSAIVTILIIAGLLFLFYKTYVKSKRERSKK